MLSFFRNDINCLLGTWKNQELLVGIHNAYKLVNHSISCKSNELSSVHLVKKLYSVYSARGISTGKKTYSIGKNVSKEPELLDLRNDRDTLQKLVKVAVIGTPNAGKSTFINRLVKRRVCSISSKVHTTRNRTQAIVNEGSTQVIFLDTPGLVNASESKRHNLEKSFLVDTELSMEESDLIVLIHDVSNVWTRDRLDFKVLRLLHFYHNKPSVLVMNKVDSLKSKRKLLELTQRLTCESLKWTGEDENSDLPSRGVYRNGQLTKDDYHPIPAMDIDKVLKDEVGWSYFENVFMISALKGEGIDPVKECILQKAITRPWLYPPSVFTDQKMEDLIVLAVREKLLENLPQEVPYNIDTELEHANISPTGDVTAIVLIKCTFMRHAKMLLSGRGRRIRGVAKSAEEALESTFMENVRLNLVVQHKK